MSGITLKEVGESTIPTPATGKATVFMDDALGPAYKDDTGTVTALEGIPGQGVPAGGTAGQVLEKIDGTNYNTQWADPSGGIPDAPIDGTGYVRKDGAWAAESGDSGAVDSVNGQTGSVQIDAEDVPYDNAASGLTATDVQGAIDEVVADIAGLTGAVVDVITPSNVSGTVTLDFDGKSKYIGEITLAVNVTTLAFSNLPGAGKYAEYELHIAQDGTGSRTFAIPASHKALGGSDTAIASAANAVTVLTASTVSNGTTWRYAMQESA